MNALNSILIEGNLTRDPEYKTVKGDLTIATFSVAHNRYRRVNGEMQEETSFFDVTAFGRTAETMRDKVQPKKGRGVRVVGRLTQDRWTNDEGENRSKVKIIAEHMEYRKPREETPQTATAQTAGEEEFSDDIPF